jgi:hypothetical protein
MPRRRAPTKYLPLVEWLQARPAATPQVSVTFTEIERIIGDTLPTSAGLRGFWASSGTAHSNWQRVGFRAHLDRQAERVVFTRGQE